MKNRKISRGVSALAAGLALGVVSFGAHAGGPVVYGQFNVSLDQLDNGEDSELGISSNSSRFGIKGDVEVQEGLKAIYQVESEIRVDNGADTGTPANGSVLASRDTFVGLAGGFGTVRAGQFDTPVKVIGRRVELFSDRVGDARNFTRVPAGSNLARFDERPRNSIAYTTPDISGLQGVFQYSTNLNSGVAGDDQSELVSVAGLYASGPLFVGLGYESVTNPNDAQDDPSAIRLSAYYDVADWRFTGLYQTVSGITSDFDHDVFGVGARFRTGPWTFAAQIYQLSADADEADSTLLAAGGEYALSKAVSIYGVYAVAENDDGAALTPYSQGRGDSLGGVAAGESPSGLSLGTVVRF